MEKFYRTGSTAGIVVAHSAKLKRILARLDSSKQIQDMNVPGWSLHSLSGGLTNHWSVKVNASWRVTFILEDGHAEAVNYQDYH